MPTTENVIRSTYTDAKITEILNRGANVSGAYSRHFNQVEEFFLRFDRSYTVPEFPIHHDVRNPVPESAYLELLTEVLQQLVPLAPQLFRGLTYRFDPTEILRPSFFHIDELDSRQYLYLLRVDLMYRPRAHQRIGRDSNDRTTAYSSDCLFLESCSIPIREAEVDPGTAAFTVDQTISDTWIDEIGRGYLVQGIWMDNDLTKFFSKLFLPPGKRTYPFYPFACKYKTVCQNHLDPDPPTRQKLLPYLQEAVEYLRPVMPEIEAALKESDFSEQLETFRRLKASLPSAWQEVWNGLHVETYLNTQDMKEYRIDDEAL